MKPRRTRSFTKEKRAQGFRETSWYLWWMICFFLLTAGWGQMPAYATAKSNAATDIAPLPHIDAKRAFEYTREVTAFGPRYIGSENHKKLERYIIDHLKGDQVEVEDDAFTADTVEGKFPVRNIIAKFPGTKDGII